MLGPRVGEGMRRIVMALVMAAVTSAAMPAHDAFHGRPGEVFLTYTTTEGHVIESFGPGRIIEPRTLELLTKGY